MSGSQECRTQRRRAQVRARRLNGIDGVEASDDGLTLTVTFLGRAPRRLEASNIRIDGGRRVTGVQVLGVALDVAADPELDDEMRVTVDRPGDTSTYTLRVVEAGPHGRAGSRPYPGFDPRYSCAGFTFRPQCPGDQDCVPAPVPAATVLPGPVIDYTARDYDSFRRLLLDRAALTSPRWVEQHVPDLQVTLVELLAYVGDQLSYQQDAVATEAYLDTARRRVSVRRHARLIDYRMHDGCNARTFVGLAVTGPTTVDAGSFRFAAVDLSRVEPRDRPDLAVVLADGELDRLPAGAVSTVFEPLSGDALALRPAHNEIRFWTWGDEECCLPNGATRATLRDTWLDHAGPDSEPNSEPNSEPDRDKPEHGRGEDGHDGHGQDRRPRALRLAAGDLLLIEEVRGPGTGAAADADPGHRQVVRLTSVAAGVDDLYDQPVLEVTWAPQDALGFATCLSARGGPDCAVIDDISVARGNLVAVDNGRSLTFCDGEPERLTVPPADIVLPGCQPAPGCADRIEAGPAVAAMHALLAAARAGRPLSTEDLLVLRPLVGQAALDRAGLLPDEPAPAQVAALEALLAQLSYPPVRTRFRPALAQSPVTQRTPFPLPAWVADGQATVLDGIPERARQRVAEFWRAVRDEHRLSRGDTEELAVLFGQSTLDELELAEHPARGLRELLARFGELLGGKLTRIGALAGRARDGVVLGDDVVWEIRYTWGERYADGLDPAGRALAGPAAAVTGQDPRDALPEVSARGYDAGDQFVGTWVPRRDLLASGPQDRDFVGELDDDGRLVLRFGGSARDDPHGAAPPAGGVLALGYRVGNGSAGNVGAEAVRHLLVCGPDRPAAVTGVRNPVPATGGVDPEPVDAVRQLAPLALRDTRLRAVTAADYAELAAQVPGVARTAAQLCWTGAGVEVVVAVDPLGAELPGADILSRVDRAIEPYRRIGHDVVVAAARLVPLEVALRVCVADGFQSGHVRAALLAALGTGLLGDGRPAFFHPDALTFGEPVRASRLVALATELPGVLSAQLIRLRRLGGADEGELAAGLLPLGPLEIGQCDNLFDRPENGRLSIVLEGGR